MFPTLASALTPKSQYLGTMVNSMPQSTPATLIKSNVPTSPITPANPAATAPVSVPPASAPLPTTPKSTYVNNVATTTTPPAPTAPITGNATTPSGAVVNSGTGALVSGPTPPTPASSTDNYTAAFQQYLSSLGPSTDETAATKYLNDLTLQAQKDQETALGRGETLGFATGEAARVGKNNSFAIDAASNALNALTSKRTALTDAEKAKVDYLKSLLPSDAGFSLSPGENRYDAKGNIIASGPAKPPNTTIRSIGGNDVLIDDQGNIIKTIGRSTSNTTQTQADKQAEALGQVNSLLQPGTTDSAGVPYVDSSGYITAQGFKTLVAAAQSSGIDRKTFLQEYAAYLFPGPASDYAGYGLTGAESKALRGY